MVDARNYQKRKPSKRKDKSIHISLNQEEKDAIVEKARIEGLPVSTWIRWKLLKE